MSQALRLYFLTVTKIYSQNLEIKASKGFQRLGSPKVIKEGYDAVKAGVTMSVSNGPVEGHINRLKMLKRQMYGRAKIDLLERRFLLAT
ncbi:hypothetical protein [Atlanticothrix silvestris]|uniref:hypothetical protein n=1 Tax=Atlanticothrix silvestris TaxID=2840444 RepID=UPI001BDD62AB|nr:hypothetical protein [Atlanticothrix silvestris]